MSSESLERTLFTYFERLNESIFWPRLALRKKIWKESIIL